MHRQRRGPPLRLRSGQVLQKTQGWGTRSYLSEEETKTGGWGTRPANKKQALRCAQDDNFFMSIKLRRWRRVARAMILRRPLLKSEKWRTRQP